MNVLRRLVQTIKTRKLAAALILIAAGGGMGLIWLHQVNYGVGVSPDAIRYLSVAENLSAGRGLFGLHGQSFNSPPLFEYLVALVISLTTGNGSSAAGYVNIGCFGLIIIAASVWVYPKIYSKFWLVWVGAICALSPALIHVSLYARTDSMYILFTVLSLHKLDQWLAQSKESNLILAATYASLSSLTRHTGFATILTALIIISLRKKVTFRAKVRYITIYSLISALPSAIWMLRSYFQIGRLTETYTSENDFSSILNGAKWEFIKMFLGDLGDHYLWLLSQRLGITVTSMRDYLLVFSAAILGVGIVYLYRKGMGGGLAIPLVFVLVYTLFLSASIGFEISGFLPRYLTPMYVPLLVVIVIVLDRSLNFLPQLKRYNRSLVFRHSADKIVGLIALGSIILLIPPTIKQIKVWQENGISYASKAWAESETTRYVKSNPASGIVYSNQARVLFTHMDISNKAKVSFRPLGRSLSDSGYTWDDRDYLWGDRSRGHEIDRHVIWYTSKYSATDPPYDFLAIASLSQLKIALILEDGVVLADEGLEPALALDAVLRDARLVVRSGFDVYLDDDRIVYLADPCRGIDAEAPFFLHIVPADPDDLPYQGKASDMNFGNYDFDFNRDGFRFGERCAAIRNLPDYDIEVIRTGQYNPQGDVLWKEEIHDLRLASGRSD